MKLGKEYQEGWYASHYNFKEHESGKYNFPKKVIIHDNTLREGEQHVGVSFTKEQKKMLLNYHKREYQELNKIKNAIPFYNLRFRT